MLRGAIRWLSPFIGEWYVLRTDLSVEECSARLLDETPVKLPLRFSLGAPPLDGAIVGTIGDDTFRFTRYTPGFRSSFRLVAAGRLTPITDGTQIDVRIGMTEPVIAILGAWTALVGVAIVLFVLGSIHMLPPSVRVSASSGAAVPGLMVMLALPLLARSAAASEGPWLLRFLLETLDATVASDNSDTAWRR